MSRCRVLAVAAMSFASALLTACATTPPGSAPGGSAVPIEAKAKDPFEGCKAEETQGVSVLSCGEIVGALANEPGGMEQQLLDRNLEDFQAQFPPAAKRERFTQTLGEQSASGIRVIQHTGGSPFRAELLIIPIDQQQTRMVSCAVRGSTDFDRCARMIEALSSSGIPAKLTEPNPKP